jgi:YfiH family protein
MNGDAIDRKPPAAGRGSAATPPFVLAADARGRLRGRFPALSTVEGLVHAVTTRGAPSLPGPSTTPRIAKAAAELAHELDLSGCAWMLQVHGAAVRRVRTSGLAGEADALWTTEPDLALLGRSADCPLVLVAEAGAPRSDRVLGIAHASWRSTVAGISARLITAMISEGAADPNSLVVAVGPSAGPCCYEVGEEVRGAMRAKHGAWADAWFAVVAGRLHLDLWRANCDQLLRAGVVLQRIHVAGVCTICRRDLFPSHRADRSDADRFAALLGWRRLRTRRLCP